jgi:hypothetical protein
MEVDCSGEEFVGLPMLLLVEVLRRPFDVHLLAASLEA